MRRTRRLIALALLLIAALPTSARAAQPPITFTVQPVSGSNTVMAKVAPGVPGDPGRWELNYYFDIKNTNPSGSVSIVSVALTVNGNTTTTAVNQVLAPGARTLINVPATPGGTLPAPTGAIGTVNARDYDPAPVRLEESVGSLRLTSDPPGGRIFLDGEAMGVTPKDLARVCSGKHRIEVKHAAEYSAERSAISAPTALSTAPTP